jgi:CMP-N-acetylneuraminic acid synthetase
MKKIGIFIPGRLKSERLPNKLILPLGESNLWDMACKKLNQLPNQFNKYVLCYDDELIQIANKYSNLKVIVRDKSTTEVDGPLTYIFKELKDLPDDYLMFLNPCLSFLKKETILESLIQFQNSPKEYATSVKEYKNWLWNSDVENLTPIDYESLSTKTIPVHYEAAHCFHIFNQKMFFKNGKMLSEDLELINVPKLELIDVDDYLDYQYAQYTYNNQKN